MLGFFSYSLTMAITPGPNNIMAMQESRQRGFRGGLAVSGWTTGQFSYFG